MSFKFFVLVSLFELSLNLLAIEFACDLKLAPVTVLELLLLLLLFPPPGAVLFTFEGIPPKTTLQ